MSSGDERALEFVYATSIGPDLRALDEGTQACFREAYVSRVCTLCGDGSAMGTMATSELIGTKR